MSSTNSISTLLLFFVLLLTRLGLKFGPTLQKKLSQTVQEILALFPRNQIQWNGSNAKNATSAIIGTPPGGNKVTFSSPNRFGDLIAFDNPITLDHNLYSKPVGRARGIYTYTSKETSSAWFSISFVFRSKSSQREPHTFEGADTIMETTRDLLVVGGTGDFFMARGIATLVPVMLSSFLCTLGFVLMLSSMSVGN